MSCENCNILIRNIVGTPTAYKIRWTKLPTDGVPPVEPVYINNGPITAEEIRSQVNPDGSGGYEIFAGGPDHATLGQFWDGNTVSIRFENYYNTDCYLDVQYSCEPATTTTAPVTDCCAGFEYAIKTTGTSAEQTPLAGLSTTGFAEGSFLQTLDPDGFGYTVNFPGTGKLCFGAVRTDDGSLRQVGETFQVYLENLTGQLVQANGEDLLQLPFPPVGSVMMMRPWQDNTNGSEVVYVAPNGLCFRGRLDETDQFKIATLVEQP
jgi:hypothetical protein